MIIYLSFDIGLIIAPSVQGHRLIDQETAVHWTDEEFLSRGQTFAFWCPNVQSDPRLREQPQQPRPGHLSGSKIAQSKHWWALEEQVVGNGSVEEARITVSDAAGCNQQRDRHRNRQIDGERVAEALNEDLASELPENVAQIRGNDLNEQHVDDGIVVGVHFNCVADLRLNNVWQTGAEPSRHLLDDDFVRAECVAEQIEQVHRVVALEPQYDDERAEKHEDFPQREENAVEVSGGA